MPQIVEGHNVALVARQPPHGGGLREVARHALAPVKRHAEIVLGFGLAESRRDG
jgi:hypothetical protein